MRFLALLAALALVPTGAFALSTSAHQPSVAAPLGQRALVAMSSPLHLHPWLSPGRTTLQTGATAVPTGGTATPVPSTTPVATTTPVTTTPVATGTITNYADPVNLLNNMIQVYQQVRSAHFQLVTNDEQPKQEKLHIGVTGDVTCKGPALKGHLSARDTQEATNKVSELSLNFIVVKKAAYQKSKSTKGQWKKISAKLLAKDFGISADNVLLCPSSSSSSGGSSSGNNSTIKNLVNLGPATFQGHTVWHIQATEVSTDSSNQQVQGTLDLLIDQARYVPYEIMYTATNQGVTQIQKQILTKFGEKLTIKAPKIAKKASHKAASHKKTSHKKTTHKKKP